MILYDERITNASLEFLIKISKMMDFPVCLCGGWAVYFTVNDIFKKKKERYYIGSQDIDIGFFIPPMVTRSEFESTSLFKTLEILMKNEFQPDGFRYKKDLFIEKIKGISNASQPDLFSLYIDILVNSYPTSIYDIYPNYFFEVPLLEDVYSNEEYQIRLPKISDNIFIPKRSILTAMKIRSLPTRGKENHKKIKDLCDIYSLLWFSENSIHENFKELLPFTDSNYLMKLKDSIDDRLASNCERYLGEPEGSIKTILQIIDDHI